MINWFDKLYDKNFTSVFISLNTLYDFIIKYILVSMNKSILLYSTVHCIISLHILYRTGKPGYGDWWALKMRNKLFCSNTVPIFIKYIHFNAQYSTQSLFTWDNMLHFTWNNPILYSRIYAIIFLLLLNISINTLRKYCKIFLEYMGIHSIFNEISIFNCSITEFYNDSIFQNHICQNIW